VIGLLLFFVGGAYILQPPSVPNFALVSVVLASAVVGFFVSYLFVKGRKGEDLSL
jgi:uncharacterized membrane protein YwzB